MRRLIHWLTPSTIAGRLVFWFLAIALLPLSVITLLTYSMAAYSLEQSVRNNLLVISEAKANQIETYAADKMRSVTAQARNPYVTEVCVNLTRSFNEDGVDSARHKALMERYRPYLSYYSQAFKYADLLLASPEGRIIFSANDSPLLGGDLVAGELDGTELAKLFDRAGKLLQTDASDFAFYKGMNDPAAFIAGPVLDSTGVLVGIFIMQIDNDDIYGVITDYTGLGATGETVVGSLQGDEVTYVAPLRSDASAAFRRKIRMGSNRSTRIQQAVRGGKGYGPGTDYRGLQTATVWTYLPSFRWGMVVKQDDAEAYALIHRQGYAMLAMAGTVIIPVVIVAMLIARSISRPIGQAVRLAERVAAGDLTAKVEVERVDETGRLLTAIATMTANLNSLIGRVQKSSIQLLSSATQIASTSTKQESTIRDFGTSTTEISAAANEISATSEELLGTVTEVTAVAHDTATVADVGRSGLAEMEKSMRQLEDATRSITQKLSVLSEKAAGITVVVTTITKVADQTNLLSVNATIEAEKAGDAGRGFRVVAREIRRLADQTAVATLDIERMVKDMQSAVSAGAMEMDRFRNEVRTSVQDVDKIAKQLGDIIEPIKALTSRFAQVNEGMRSQSLGARQIRDAMLQLSDGARQTAVSLDQFRNATNEMRGAVNGLNEEVTRFKISG